MSGETKRKIRRRLRWACGIAFVLCAFDYWLYPQFISPGGLIVNRGENGIWLRYTWYFGEHSRRDVELLADRLDRHGIREAFFHVRGVDGQGLLSYHRLAEAKALNRDLALRSPRLRRVAWIHAGNSQGHGSVDLRSVEVRRRMAKEAAWLVRDAGFDGVQWDYEICPNGDEGLLKLLDETRSALPKGAYLGVDVPGWYPWPLSAEGWSDAYYGNVARRCDGMAVMAYDSGMITPRAYVWWVSQQVIHVTKAVAGANPSCRVLMGVPTYKDSTLSHNARAENLRLALIGVRRGLAGGADNSSWQGVAVFADYATNDADWMLYDQLWPWPRP